MRNPVQFRLHGNSDGFIAPFMADGTLEYGAWLVGAGKERFSAIALDRWNRIHATGHSRSEIKGPYGLAMPRMLVGVNPTWANVSHEPGIEPCSQYGNGLIDA